MNLATIPFDSQELKKKYTITSFQEAGILINVLNDVNANKNRKLPSGNCYKFGVIVNGEFFWYFNGNPVKVLKGKKVDREGMREIYQVLLQINRGTKNRPFIYKVNR